MANILVIDDDEKICMVFKRFLQSRDHVVQSTTDGLEGLRLVDEQPPDVVITDIMMPVVDGLQIISTVREKHPKVHVIAVSGGIHAMPMDYLTLAKNFGASKVLNKPVLLHDLIGAVDELLNPDN